MDRKSLILVFVCTLIFIGTNHYFDSSNLEDKRARIEKEKTLKEQELTDLISFQKNNSLQNKTLSTPYFFSRDDEKPRGYGFLSENSFLTITTKEPLPDTIFVGNKAESSTERKRLTGGKELGGYALFSKGESEKLQIATLSPFENATLQTIDVIDGRNLVATSSAGSFQITLEKIAELKSALSMNETEAPPIFALVLKKVDDQYLPLALYDREEKSLTYLESIQSLQPYEVAASPNYEPSQTGGEVSYYVIETPYQQLVFSSRGGALAEINLPFNTTSPESVVKEIGFDREILRDTPVNALFPMHSYFVADENTQGPYKKIHRGKEGGYYPLLRRDLIDTHEGKTFTIPPSFYAFNVVSQYPETAKLDYKVEYFDKNKLVFVAKQAHRKIKKTYTVVDNLPPPYCLDLEVEIEGDARGLWITTGVTEVEWINGATAPALKLRNTRGEVESLSLPDAETTNTVAGRDWICNSNGFFGIILDPLSQLTGGYRTQFIPGNQVPSRLILIDPIAGRFKTENLPGYTMYLPLNQTQGSMKFRAYSGPFAGSVLREVDQIFKDPLTGETPDYVSAQSYHGFFTAISKPIMAVLLFLIQFFHGITGSWGFSIILLTVALRIMLYPVNAWSTKSMEKMKRIAPKVAEINEKYKKDPKKLQLETMNLYRKEGVNPFSGCFPMLIQLPFFIAMFDLLKSTFELRGAPFIPGWIDNLAAPDVVFSWNVSLPLIGNQFHLLPILLGIVMFFQQRLMTGANKDPKQMTDQQRQQLAMSNILSLVFVVMFWNFPSGLCIYWLSSSILGILQQLWTQKKLSDKDLCESGKNS